MSDNRTLFNTTRQAIAISAREMGHDLAPWNFRSGENVCNTDCRHCGLHFTLVVAEDGTVATNYAGDPVEDVVVCRKNPNAGDLLQKAMSALKSVRRTAEPAYGPGDVSYLIPEELKEEIDKILGTGLPPPYDQEIDENGL